VAEVSFTVYGTPAPQGSKRHVGNGVMVESSAAVRPWRQAVAWTWRSQFGHRCLLGAVEVAVTFYVARPSGHYLSDGSRKPNARPFPSVVPDLDKYLRSTLDALGKDTRAIADDSRVVTLTARKLYADGVAPGAVICIKELEIP
jgi:crossover junction endodeoxyribonuclease RusA